jgi:hypothetical protein
MTYSIDLEERHQYDNHEFHGTLGFGVAERLQAKLAVCKPEQLERFVHRMHGTFFVYLELLPDFRNIFCNFVVWHD